MQVLERIGPPITRAELPLALAMFCYFFLVITCFWILKPIKKGMFIQFYDQDGFTLLGTHFSASQAELLAKVLNMGVAFLAVVVFTVLSHSLRRQHLSYALAGAAGRARGVEFLPVRRPVQYTHGSHILRISE